MSPGDFASDLLDSPAPAQTGARVQKRQVLDFFVDGIPAPKGSLKAMPFRKSGSRLGVRVFEDNIRTKGWREAIAWRAKSEALYVDWRSGDDELAVSLFFYLPRPKSAGRRSRPNRKPDLDKLVRSVLDALQDAEVVMQDDSRVCELEVKKLYADDPLVEGVAIRIERLLPLDD